MWIYSNLDDRALYSHVSASKDTIHPSVYTDVHTLYPITELCGPQLRIECISNSGRSQSSQYKEVASIPL